MSGDSPGRARFTRSLRFRLTVLVAGLFAVALIVAALVTRSYLRGELEADAREAAVSLLDDYLAPSLELVPTVDESAVTRVMYLDGQGQVIPASTVDRIIVESLEGLFPEMAFSTFELPIDAGQVGGAIPVAIGGGFLVVDDLPVEVLEGPISAEAVAVELFTEPGPLRDIAVDDAVAVGRDVLLAGQAVTVVVAAPTSTIDDSIDAITLVGAVAIPMLTVLVAVIAWFVTSRTLRPVEAIRAQVARTDPSSLDHHVPRPGGGDEIDRLAGTMNDMLDRLHRASQQQRRFISDASHELRSPITATLATVEAAAPADIARRWPELSATITGEQLRLQQLVDDLLLLAELDENANVDRSTDGSVDLDELVLDEVQRPRPVSVSARVEIPQRVRGSERLLARALGNLIDNAARHAVHRVEVTVTSGGVGRAVVRIDDDGPGVAEVDRIRVFERFARLDEARRRPDGGAGLGLAIVHEIVRQHQGSVSIGDSPMGGARFELTVPVD